MKLKNFAYYKAPITNKFPEKELDILGLYKLIVSEEYRGITESFRQITDKQEAREYKASRFDYVMFSGIFSERKDDCIKEISGYMVLDIDRQNNAEAIKAALSKDTFLEPLLIFTSPSGNGLKVVIEYDTSILENNAAKKLEPVWTAVNSYLGKEYGSLIQCDSGGNYIDPSGKDLSRACFICRDYECFINPKILNNNDN